MRNSAEMQRTFKLPLLPGNSCGEELLRSNFRKTQMISGGTDSKVKKEVPLDFDTTYVVNNAQGKTIGGGEASGATSNRGVLRFFGYYMEPVTESATESERVRKIVLHYFLEDDTISVSEPRTDNSGIALQGTLVKRHRIPSADGNGYISFAHLAVAQEVNVYGRQMRLVDADAATRRAYQDRGVALAEPEAYPKDTYYEARDRASYRARDIPSVASSINAQGMKVKLSQAEIRATKQFLTHDRKVLRVFAKWDDSTHLYGQARFFVLFYFLSDDTLEVTERFGSNSGYDPFPSFIRRSRIAKPRAARVDGSLTFKSSDEAPPAGFYSDSDLQIGNEIVIFGRKFFVYDYDQFTRDHMSQKFGITAYKPIDVKEPEAPAVKREPPPYNGYGDEEDSLGSWNSLDLKPPKRSHAKFDKFGYNAVKFLLKLENGVATDEIRKFVLSYFLADDSIAIFEPVQRNSGIVGGKFLQRQKVKKENGQSYTPSDFFVGAHVKINQFPFVVVATDERSLNFMESNNDTFEKSNLNGILAKLQAIFASSTTGLVQAFRKADEDNNNQLDFTELCHVFQAAGLDVSDQEVLTVLRNFDRNGDSQMSFSEFASRVLPGVAAGSDPRTWNEIYAASLEQQGGKVARKSQAEVAQQKQEDSAAAAGARIFLEAYAGRRQLFHSEFKFICDYSPDGKIGEKEFATCARDKLKLSLTDDQLRCLSIKVFPAKARRIEFSELVRLLNGNSNFDHNLTSIKDRR